jgi:hypothetical protein
MDADEKNQLSPVINTDDTDWNRKGQEGTQRSKSARSHVIAEIAIIGKEPGLEARSQEPEARSQEPEARSQKPEARSQEQICLSRTG